jgi:hypothetical protein
MHPALGSRGFLPELEEVKALHTRHFRSGRNDLDEWLGARGQQLTMRRLGGFDRPGA